MDLREPHGSPSTTSVGAEIPALPCRTLLFAPAASAWPDVPLEPWQVYKGTKWETPPGLRWAGRIGGTRGKAGPGRGWGQGRGGASEGAGPARGWEQEAFCLKMYGEPLNNFDKLLAVRFEANHLTFLKLCYLEETTPFSPTGERNSQVRLLVVEYNKYIHKRLLQWATLCQQNWVPSLTNKSPFWCHSSPT